MSISSDDDPPFRFLDLSPELQYLVLSNLANPQDFGDLLTIQHVSKQLKSIARQVLRHHLPPGCMFHRWLKQANQEDLSYIHHMDMSTRSTFDSLSMFAPHKHSDKRPWLHMSHGNLGLAARFPNLKTIRIATMATRLRALASLLVGRSIVVDLRCTIDDWSSSSDVKSWADIRQLMTAGQLRSLELITYKHQNAIMTTDWNRTVANILCSPKAPLDHVSCPVPDLRVLQESPSFATANGFTKLSLIPPTGRTSRKTLHQCTLGSAHSRELVRCLHTANLRELHILYALTAPAISCLSSLRLPAVGKCTLSCPPANAALVDFLKCMPNLQEFTLVHVEAAPDLTAICASLPSQLTALHIFDSQRWDLRSSIVYSTEDIALLSTTCPHLIAVSMPISRNAVSSLQAMSAWRSLRKLNVQLVVPDLEDVREVQGLLSRPSSTAERSSSGAPISYIRAALRLCAIDKPLTREISDMVFSPESMCCELTVSACYDGFLISQDDTAERSGWMVTFAAIMRPHKLVRTSGDTHVQRLAAREPEDVVRSFGPGKRRQRWPDQLLGDVRACLYSIWPGLRTQVLRRRWEPREAHRWSDAITALPVNGYVQTLDGRSCFAKSWADSFEDHALDTDVDDEIYDN